VLPAGDALLVNSMGAKGVRMRVVSIIGTRPEAIKMAPVIQALKARSPAGIESFVVSTGQHQELMHPILECFDIRPDRNLRLMQKCQSLNALFLNAVAEVDRVCTDLYPDVVLVHGDTTSAAAAAIAAFHRKVKVGHVEAGLRTGDPGQPWPEEMNRRLITPCADFHFAPTRSAKARLLAEGVAADAILVTGNTVVDALSSVAARLDKDRALRATLDAQFSFLDDTRETILVTGHRRENCGDGIRNICKALLELSARRGVAILFPVHLNPNVLKPVKALLGGRRNIHLIPPADYVSFVYLMIRSNLILTDSGGVQEEATSLGKPVLVMRNVTERPEAISAGMAKLVGTEPGAIVAAAAAVLDGPRTAPTVRRGTNPFGDGRAAQRIVEFLAANCERAVAAEAPLVRIGGPERVDAANLAPAPSRQPRGKEFEMSAQRASQQ